MLQNLIGGLQGMVDHALVGHLVGYAGERRHRRGDPDLHRRHRVRHVGVQRDGGAGRPLRRGQRAREGQSDRLSGVPRRRRAVGTGPGPAWLGARAGAARRSACGARGARRGPALPPDHVRGQSRVAVLLHGERCVAGGRRPAHPAAAGDHADGAERGVQRRPDHGPRPPAPAGHRRRGRRHHGGRIRGERIRRLPAVLRLAARAVASRHGLAAGLGHHPGAVPLRVAHGRSGGRDERRRRAAVALHRLARPERAGAGSVRDRVHRAVLVHHVDLGRVAGRGRHGLGTEPGGGPPGARGTAASTSPRGSASRSPPRSASCSSRSPVPCSDCSG